MGLFINNDKHPEVYKNTGIRNEHNQEMLRRDFLTELLEMQQKTNLSLSHSLSEIKLQNEAQKELSAIQWRELNKQLKDFTRNEMKQLKQKKEMIERLKNLEEKNITIQSLLENENQLKQEIMKEMQIQSSVRQEMTKRIETYESLTQHLSKQIDEQQEDLKEKMEKQVHFQDEVLTRLDKQEMLNQNLSKQIDEQASLKKDLAEKLTRQEENYTEILTRLDNQEALTEKLARQINNIRSILFERTNFLAGKIEDGYKLTSSYVYKLMTGSEQPLSFFTFKNKQENIQNKQE